MKSFIGHIVAGDIAEKTMEIKCPDGISGMTMGQNVMVIPISNESLNEYGHLQRRLEKIQ